MDRTAETAWAVASRECPLCSKEQCPHCGDCQAFDFVPHQCCDELEQFYADRSAAIDEEFVEAAEVQTDAF